eukprot:693445-Rhodomonas_salina.1
MPGTRWVACACGVSVRPPPCPRNHRDPPSLCLRLTCAPPPGTAKPRVSHHAADGQGGGMPVPYRVRSLETPPVDQRLVCSPPPRFCARQTVRLRPVSVERVRVQRGFRGGGC